MKKLLIALNVILFVMFATSAGFHVADALQQPKQPAACADQAAETGIVVRRGCEPGEQQHLAEIARLLDRLPAELAEGKADSLAPGTPKTDLQKALPANAKLAGYPDTWKRTGAIASMTVKVSDRGLFPRPQKVTAIFSRTDDGWKLAQTVTTYAAR